jgi:hypothetical protein
MYRFLYSLISILLSTGCVSLHRLDLEHRLDIGIETDYQTTHAIETYESIADLYNWEPLLMGGLPYGLNTKTLLKSVAQILKVLYQDLPPNVFLMKFNQNLLIVLRD